MRCVDVITHGITLIITPLLTLAVDVIQKFHNVDESHGIINRHAISTRTSATIPYAELSSSAK